MGGSSYSSRNERELVMATNILSEDPGAYFDTSMPRSEPTPSLNPICPKCGQPQYPGESSCPPIESSTPSLDEILVSEITRLLEAINIAKANPMSAYARDRAAITVRNLQSLIKSESDRILGEFAEYCHERYMGCTQVEDGWEYGYNSEVVTMLDEWRKKQ